MSPTATCAVCGRTILDGERIHAYVSAQGSHEVCPLCAPRAEAAGWLPADQADAAALAPPPRRGLLDRVLGRGGDEEDGADEPSEAPPEPVETAPEPPVPLAEADLAGVDEAPRRRVFGRRRPAEVSAPLPAEPAADPDHVVRPDPAGPGMRSRSRPLDDAEADLSPVSRFERAILRFNVSEAGRTVAGLTRTLGSPSVSVGASATGPQDVRITVAWEISWYQWGVDLSDELRPVFEIAKGFEVAELDASARQWNATAVEGGHVVMGAPARGARDDAMRR
jgi:hypothetical protein